MKDLDEMDFCECSDYCNCNTYRYQGDMKYDRQGSLKIVTNTFYYNVVNNNIPETTVFIISDCQIENNDLRVLIKDFNFGITYNSQGYESFMDIYAFKDLSKTEVKNNFRVIVRHPDRYCCTLWDLKQENKKFKMQMMVTYKDELSGFKMCQDWISVSYAV